LYFHGLGLRRYAESYRQTGNFGHRNFEVLRIGLKALFGHANGINAGRQLWEIEIAAGPGALCAGESRAFVFDLYDCIRHACARRVSHAARDSSAESLSHQRT
jgi:hypothetical protein